MLSTRQELEGIIITREDLMHACVVYTRPELFAFERVIRLRSTNSLRIRDPRGTSPAKPSINSLPPEVLLRIRSFLQTVLSVHLKEETASAMTRYAGAVVRSLCDECAAYNAGVFGDDVWNWIENGCKAECACRAKYAGTAGETADDSARFLLRTHDGRHVASRREWLETYLSTVHLSGRPVWTDLVPAVLQSLTCQRHPRVQELILGRSPANTLLTDVELVGTGVDAAGVQSPSSSNERVVIEPVLLEKHCSTLVLKNVVRELNIFRSSSPRRCDATIFGINASEYTFRLTNLPSSHRRSYSSLSAPVKCPLHLQHKHDHARVHTTTHQGYSWRLITILCIAFFLTYRHTF